MTKLVPAIPGSVRAHRGGQPVAGKDFNSRVSWA